MDQSEVAALGTALGLSGVTPAHRLRSGLGGTELWQLQSASGPVVLRLFAAATDAAVIEREVAAHHFAIDHGIAAPRILAHRLSGDRPAVLMEWIDGATVADRLWAGENADDLGRRCGVQLAGLHAIDPTVLLPGPIGSRPWTEWARGVVPDELLTRFDDQRLLHLDFHPENMIVSDAGTLHLLDWANVRLGPPAADLARTWSILELITEAVPSLSDVQRTGVADFRAGLLAGYSTAGGVAEIPAAIQAWAYAVQLHDLAGSWVPDHYLDQLRVKINTILG